MAMACAVTVSAVPGATLLPIWPTMSNTRGTAVAVSTPTFHTGWFTPAIELGAASRADVADSGARRMEEVPPSVFVAGN